MKKQSLIYISLVTIGILLIPLIAMQFTDEVNWTWSDFVVMGTLLLITGTIFDWALRKFPDHKIVAGAIVIAAFLYIWAELAVGIFTNLGS